MNNGSIKGGLSFDRTGESRSNLVWNPISHPVIESLLVPFGSRCTRTPKRRLFSCGGIINIDEIIAERASYRSPIQGEYYFDPDPHSVVHSIFDAVLGRDTKEFVLKTSGYCGTPDAVDVYMYRPGHVGHFDNSPLHLLWGYVEQRLNDDDDLIFGAYYKGREMVFNTCVSRDRQMGGLLIDLLRGYALVGDTMGDSVGKSTGW